MLLPPAEVGYPVWMCGCECALCGCCWYWAYSIILGEVPTTRRTRSRTVALLWVGWLEGVDYCGVDCNEI